MNKGGTEKGKNSKERVKRAKKGKIRVKRANVSTHSIDTLPYRNLDNDLRSNGHKLQLNKAA